MTTDSKIYERALKFANDCGSEALGSRDFDKIKNLYKEFAIDVETLAAQEANKAVKRYQELQHEELANELIKTEREARLDEANWWNEGFGDGTPAAQDRIKTLTADKEQAPLQNKTNDGGQNGG